MPSTKRPSTLGDFFLNYSYPLLNKERVATCMPAALLRICGVRCLLYLLRRIQRLIGGFGMAVSDGNAIRGRLGVAGV